MTQSLRKQWHYNEALLPSVLPDSFAIAESSGVDPVYMNTLNIAGDEMMGSVEIPKINIKLPIYHTTEEEVLKQGRRSSGRKFSSGWWSKAHMLLFLHTVDFRVLHFLQIWIS